MLLNSNILYWESVKNKLTFIVAQSILLLEVKTQWLMYQIKSISENYCNIFTGGHYQTLVHTGGC